MSKLTAGLDPGRDKCGLSVVDELGSCLFHQVVPTAFLEKYLQELHEQYDYSSIVMGNGTTSSKAAKRVQKALPDVELIVVDEYRTTDEARSEYWKLYPPAGWRRFVPRGMLVPPEPVDDLAALILARRYVKEGKV